MDENYQIHLNFAPIVSAIPRFLINRRLRVSPEEERPFADVMAYKLPAGTASDGWQSYWISPVDRPGFEPFEVTSDLNRDLTLRMLCLAVRRSAETLLKPGEFRVPENEFIQELWFVMQSHPEGQELLVVQPYLLKVTRQFGFLLDFHFKLGVEVPFSRRVQQLSLSLDRHFKRNLDYYVDRTSKIRRFVEARWPVLMSARMPGSSTPIDVSKEFVSLPAQRLGSKVYVFADAQESRGQFAGLREHGPLMALSAPPKLLFVFREADRQAARMLALALKGPRGRARFGFPGFEALFKSDLDIDHNPVVIPDLSADSMKAALERAKNERLSHPNIVPVVILPEGDDNGYLEQKALFCNAEIPTQVCTLRILRDEDLFKWAIGNLALQIFCKAGGQPWKVRPAPGERSLIIGISQSHKSKCVDGRHEIEKYFAFSILTDSSGLFREIHVLGESDTQTNYLAQIRDSLGSVLTANAGAFSRVVIHTSFKLKRQEMKAIEETVRGAAARTDRAVCRFAVVKVNHKTRFFGVNRAVNSQVPFEATQIKLGPREYLVWFDGIFPDRTTVNKAFPGPTHLQILHIGDAGEINDEELLQDLVNLSGANWRGFNAKSAPVSVFYCHLVADLVREFHERNLPLPAVKDIRPWFL